MPTDFAGLLLFAIGLARMLLDAASRPGPRRISAGCMMRSLLALKLGGLGRPSKVLAEGLSLFTGLHVMPQRHALTEYSTLGESRFAGPS